MMFFWTLCFEFVKERLIMKQQFSCEFKIILVATVVLLAIFTAVVARQIFTDNAENVKFVYNSACADFVPEINNSDIFSEI